MYTLYNIHKYIHDPCKVYNLRVSLSFSPKNKEAEKCREMKMINFLPFTPGVLSCARHYDVTDNVFSKTWKPCSCSKKL